MDPIGLSSLIKDVVILALGVVERFKHLSACKKDTHRLLDKVRLIEKRLIQLNDFNSNSLLSGATVIDIRSDVTSLLQILCDIWTRLSSWPGARLLYTNTIKNKVQEADTYTRDCPQKIEAQTHFVEMTQNNETHFTAILDVINRLSLADSIPVLEKPLLVVRDIISHHRLDEQSDHSTASSLPQSSSHPVRPSEAVALDRTGKDSTDCLAQLPSYLHSALQESSRSGISEQIPEDIIQFVAKNVEWLVYTTRKHSHRFR